MMLQKATGSLVYKRAIHPPPSPPPTSASSTRRPPTYSNNSLFCLACRLTSSTSIRSSGPCQSLPHTHTHLWQVCFRHSHSTELDAAVYGVRCTVHACVWKQAFLFLLTVAVHARPPEFIKGSLLCVHFRPAAQSTATERRRKDT